MITTTIGEFAEEINAARAYNEWAARHHGKSANLNVLPPAPANDLVPEREGGPPQGIPEQPEMRKRLV